MTDKICLSEPDLVRLLEKAAHDGARKALSEIGLGDEYAGTDVRTLRDLLKAYRHAKKTFISSIIDTIARSLFIIVVAGIMFKIGLKVGE